MKRSLPCSCVGRAAARCAAGRRRPSDSPREAITAAGTATPSASVEQDASAMREDAPAAGQVGLARGARAARERDEDHDDARRPGTARGRSGTSIEGGTLPAATRTRRGRPLGGVGGGAAGALPAAVGGEHVAQRRAGCRRRRRAAGSRPSGAARAARPISSATSRIAAQTSSFGTRSPSPPARLASWANTPAALPRAPGSADGVGRARPTPTSSRQWGQRRGSSGQSSPTFRSIRRWQCGQ